MDIIYLNSCISCIDHQDWTGGGTGTMGSLMSVSTAKIIHKNVFNGTGNQGTVSQVCIHACRHWSTRLGACTRNGQSPVNHPWPASPLWRPWSISELQAECSFLNMTILGYSGTTAIDHPWIILFHNIIQHSMYNFKNLFGFLSNTFILLYYRNIMLHTQNTCNRPLHTQKSSLVCAVINGTNKRPTAWADH